METSIGASRDIVVKKSSALRILLLLKKKDICVSDIPYALSCLELINIDGSITTNIKGINPLLTYRKIFLDSLHILYFNRLILINKNTISLTIDGINYLEGLASLQAKEINDLIRKIDIIGSVVDYRKKYIDLTKEYDDVLSQRDFYRKINHSTNS